MTTSSRQRSTQGRGLLALAVLLGWAAGCGGGPSPAPAPAPSPPGLRTVAAWEARFLSRWDEEHRTDLLPRSTSGDSWQYYFLAYGIDGNTAMYRATGDPRYLDRALLYVDNMVADARPSSSLRRSQFKDGYLGWASGRRDTRGREVPLFESYCWRYVTRLLRVLRETPALYEDARYRATYERLLAFTERNVFEKWYRRGAEAFVFRSRTHLAAHWAFMALDLSRLTTDEARRATYLAVLEAIDRGGLPNHRSSLRAQLVPSPAAPGAYFWSDRWGAFARPGQDVDHGNGVLAFVVEAHDVGVEWTDQDVRAFAATLGAVVWPEAGRYARFVDGSGAGRGFFNDGWMKLGRYDAALQRRLEAHPVLNDTQFLGNGALNARYLLGPAPP